MQNPCQHEKSPFFRFSYSFVPFSRIETGTKGQKRVNVSQFRKKKGENLDFQNLILEMGQKIAGNPSLFVTNNKTAEKND